MNCESEYAGGVDVSLIRWSLSLTPAERLDHLHELIEFFSDVRKRNGIEPIGRDPAGAE